MTGKEVLRAIADGADPSEFEILGVAGKFDTFDPASYSVNAFYRTENQFRRKPRTRVVNGFTVPAPIQEMPKDYIEVFLSQPQCLDFIGYLDFQSQYKQHLIWLSRGLLFSTKEAAIANAKAMVGIDPNGEA